VIDVPPCGDRRKSTSRPGEAKAGRSAAIGITAALLVLAACDGGDRPGDSEPEPSGSDAEEIATSFVGAYGAFNAEAIVSGTRRYLELIGSVGAHRGVRNPEGCDAPPCSGPRVMARR
jgi:hypothetical protein